jgi:hypothetical protein
MFALSSVLSLTGEEAGTVFARIFMPFVAISLKASGIAASGCALLAKTFSFVLQHPLSAP